MLHGRGSTGEEYAEELLESTLPGQLTMVDSLSTWKFVFPSSKEVWSTAFREDMPAWFEAHSLSDPTARQELQVPGILDSVKHISAIVDGEILKLNGQSHKVCLGGISQGAAVGMLALLSRPTSAPRIGAFFAASTWLPFASDILHLISGESTIFNEERAPRDSILGLLSQRQDLNGLPVHLGHGHDDAYVDVELGRVAAKVLSAAGCAVDWKEYNEAEQEGHWYKVPEQIDDTVAFLGKLANS